jgi:hypothetical protein
MVYKLTPIECEGIIPDLTRAHFDVVIRDFKVGKNIAK